MSLTTAIGQVKDNEILLRDKNGQPKLIKFKETKISAEIQSINIFLKSQFKASDKTEFKLKNKSTTDNLGFESKKLQQFHNKIKVEFGILNAISKDGQLISSNGNYIELKKNLSTIPKLTEQQALEFVLKYVSAKKYAWQNLEKEEVIKQLKKDPNATYHPKGELVIIEKDMYSENPIPTLAYKFDIYALNPMSRSNYYIDTSNGEIIFIDAILKHIKGIGATRYSGQRIIETQQSGGQFRLRDNTKGDGIITYNNDNQLNHTNTDYTDNDNNWSVAEFNNANGDNAGLDAHWGAMKTYEYFLSKHNRNSINNNGYSLINYVNANLMGWGFANSDNAFWDGNVMTYGMGTNLNPLVSIDIIAHEIGHGLDQFTSDLVYQRESGAIDEGLSDIWGAMVEFYAAPEKNTYTLGEDIGLIIRSMSDPKSRDQPDTFEGNFWSNPNCGTPKRHNDYCGVHTNSGILNHWFYLLAEGSSATDGVNDNGDNFNIVGIGKDKAVKVIYRAQTVYFTSTTDYEDARLYTIQAAEDLFGVNSLEVITTNNAWYAVGIGDLIASQLEGDSCACYNLNTTFILTNFSNQPVSWQVSTNIQVVSSDNNSVTVKATSNSKGNGFIIANIGGEQIRKDIWVGRPNSPTSIYGPTGVLYGALVHYSASSVQGATSYKWYLPYPYDQNATVTVDPLKWGILSGGNSKYLSAIVGPNDGLVQFMGTNKCGTGGAKLLNVTIGTTSGGVSPSGGNIPFSTFGDFSNKKKITIFPNPTSNYVYIYSPSKSKYLVQIIDINGKTLIEKNISDSLTKLDISSLPNNIYFIKVTGKENSVKKLIIQR